MTDIDEVDRLTRLEEMTQDEHDYLSALAVADKEHAKDLAELDAAGFTAEIADEWEKNPEPDEDTDDKDHS